MHCSRQIDFLAVAIWQSSSFQMKTKNNIESQFLSFTLYTTKWMCLMCKIERKLTKKKSKISLKSKFLCVLFFRLWTRRSNRLRYTLKCSKNSRKKNEQQKQKQKWGCELTHMNYIASAGWVGAITVVSILIRLQTAKPKHIIHHTPYSTIHFARTPSKSSAQASCVSFMATKREEKKSTKEKPTARVTTTNGGMSNNFGA